MTGSVTKRVTPSGKLSYLIRISLGIVDGKRRFHTETCHGSKREADNKLRDLIKQFEQGTLTEPNKVSMAAFMSKWLDEAAGHGRKLRTLQDYRTINNCYITPELGKYPLAKVTPMHVQEFVNKLAKQLAPQTVRNVVNVLKVAFSQARSWRFITFNPATEIDLPRKNLGTTIRAFNSNQVAQFMAALEGHSREVVLKLALATGARPGEYLALKWDDLDLTAGAVRIDKTLMRPKGGGWRFDTPKTKKSKRVIPIPGEVVSLLRRHKGEQLQQRLLAGPKWVNHDLVFTSQFGAPLDGVKLAKVFNRVLKAAELPKEFRLYDLRHTCATLLMAAGINPKVVSERLGHSTVMLTLDTYTSVLPTMQREATDKIGAVMFGQTSKFANDIRARC